MVGIVASEVTASDTFSGVSDASSSASVISSGILAAATSPHLLSFHKGHFVTFINRTAEGSRTAAPPDVYSLIPSVGEWIFYGKQL